MHASVPSINSCMHTSHLLCLKTALLGKKSVCEESHAYSFELPPASTQIIKLCAVDGVLKCWKSSFNLYINCQYYISELTIA